MLNGVFASLVALIRLAALREPAQLISGGKTTGLCTGWPHGPASIVCRRTNEFRRLCASLTACRMQNQYKHESLQIPLSGTHLFLPPESATTTGRPQWESPSHLGISCLGTVRPPFGAIEKDERIDGFPPHLCLEKLSFGYEMWTTRTKFRSAWRLRRDLARGPR